ncbi:MAG: VWA domain-containing protein [Alphaproteobacteria bacterium]|nr:VWA domain-containing protein [Alphaproteobacteria bacterium]
MKGLPWLVVGATGCIEFALDPIESDEPAPQSVVVEESFVQVPLPGVDLLLVIDDTASMAQEQAALGDQLVALLDDLDAAELSWQLGVVTTDMSGDEAGWLRGSPYVLTPNTPDRATAFADAVAVGTLGGGPEAGLAAAVQALSLAADGGPNAGFRRDDALLHVLFVSDVDDQSEAWLGDDPAAGFLDVLSAEAARTGRPARASGLVGPVPSGCSSTSGTARPAERYEQVVAASGGVQVSICEPDFTPVVGSLTEASTEWLTRFALREEPLEGQVRVVVDALALSDGWRVDGRTLVFDEPPPPGARIEVTYTIELEPAG